MKVNFIYDKGKDVWCLLNKGKSSNNSQNPTKQYELLVEKYGENPTPEDAALFVNQYIEENKIDVSGRINFLEQEWQSISQAFQARAEAIFGISITKDIDAYLTINSRCPYSIHDNFFYVSIQSNQSRRTLMHELWHFYTWYGLGEDQEGRLGKQKYNDLKESLTVLLNIECKDLLPEGVLDMGYPQHSEIRQRVVEHWHKDKNIHNLWNHLINFLPGN